MVIGYPAQIYGFLSGSRFPEQHEQGLNELEFKLPKLMV